MATRQSQLSTRRRVQRQDARRRLLDVARRLLEERGWSEVSLEEITSAAGVARTAFYRHFEDRQHLLIALLEDVDLELNHAGDAWWIADNGDSATDVRESLAHLTRIFVEHGRLLQAISDTARHDPGIGEVYDALAGRLIRATVERIERDVEAGRSDVSNPPEVARALTLLNERYLLASFGSRPFSDPDVVAHTLAGIWHSVLYGTDV